MASTSGSERILTTSDLTRGEKLYIARRRKGLTQIEMSVDCGVAYGEYRAMETDDPGTKPPYITLGTLLEREAYTIMRRRSGLSRDEVADKMDVSTFWLRQMEAGAAPIKRLAQFWGASQ